MSPSQQQIQLQIAAVKAVSCGLVVAGRGERVNVAIEIVADPSLLFLDEPTSGLDASGAAEVVRQLKVAAKARAVFS